MIVFRDFVIWYIYDTLQSELPADSLGCTSSAFCLILFVVFLECGLGKMSRYLLQTLHNNSFLSVRFLSNGGDVGNFFVCFTLYIDLQTCVALVSCSMGGIRCEGICSALAVPQIGMTAYCVECV